MEASSGSNGWSIGVPMGLLPSHVKVSSGSKGWSSRTYRSACRLARTAVWVFYHPIMEAPSVSSRWSIGVPMRLLPFHVKVSSDSNEWSSYTYRSACGLVRTAVWVYCQPIVMETSSDDNGWSSGLARTAVWVYCLPIWRLPATATGGLAVWPERPYWSIASPYGDFQRRQRMV